MHGRVALPAWAPRAVKVGTVTMVAAGLALAVVLVAWPHLFSSGASRLRPGPGDSLIGEAEGWVKSAEPSTSTIRVSSGFLGLSSVSLVVTPDTLIIVGARRVDSAEEYFEDDAAVLELPAPAIYHVELTLEHLPTEAIVTTYDYIPVPGKQELPSRTDRGGQRRVS